MQVELTTSRAGFRKSHEAGEIVDLPEKEARRLINAGDAIPVRSTRGVETTVRRAAPRRRAQG